jgi:hypothetical protein
MLERGDRIKLTEAVAQGLMKAKDVRNGKRGRPRCDWLKRRGVVLRVAQFTKDVTVLWDDRPSPDQWPATALERTARS